MGIEGGAVTVQHSLTMMRCERCRAVVSNAEAPALIEAGTRCGVCGGVLTLAGVRGRPQRADTEESAAPARPGP